MLPEPIPNVKKIVVLRVNAIGDFVFTLPALRALRETYPKAEITLIAKSWVLDFMKNRKGIVDKIEVMPNYPVINTGEINELKIEKFIKRMREEQFDLAFQLQGGGRESNPFIEKLNAKNTFGCKTEDAIALDNWVPFFYSQSEVNRNLEVLAMAGAFPKSHVPELEVTDADLLESYGVLDKDIENFVIIHPGATDLRRRWPAKRYAEVADEIINMGHKVILVGSKDDEKEISNIIEWMKEKPLVLVSCLSLNGFLGLLKRARILIGNDSGPRHLAEAVGTPNIGLYWCINIINAGPSFREINRPLISWQTICPFCHSDLTDVGHDKKSCNHKVSLLTKISTEQVIAQVKDLLLVTKNSFVMEGSEEKFSARKQYKKYSQNIENIRINLQTETKEI